MSKLFKRIFAVVAIVGAFFSLGNWMGGTPSDASIRDRIVKLVGPGGRGSCTGEQIQTPSGKDYIITAAHCAGLASGNLIEVVREDGTKYESAIIAEDPYSDLLLLEGIPKLSGLKIAEFSKRRQNIRTFSHGRGYDTYTTYGVIVQDSWVTIPMKPISSPEEEADCVTTPKYKSYPAMFGGYLCALSVLETTMTAKVVPGSSGGAVVDEDGNLVGVISATDGSFGYYATLGQIQRFLSRY